MCGVCKCSVCMCQSLLHHQNHSLNYSGSLFDLACIETSREGISCWRLPRHELQLGAASSQPLVIMLIMLYRPGQRAVYLMQMATVLQIQQALSLSLHLSLPPPLSPSLSLWIQTMKAPPVPTTRGISCTLCVVVCGGV